MYYVIKTTIEDSHNTQNIFSYEKEREAIVKYHTEFAGTITYDTVKVCTVMLVDDYAKVIKSDRYERSSADPDPTDI